VPRRQWAERGFTVCDDCRAAVRYASLEVVKAEAVEEFVEMIIRQGQEREALIADVERELRRFVRVYDQQPEWLWSPATVKFVRAVRPKLELLGGQVGPARVDDVATPEEAYRAE
jgi:glycyl-tRNA synthetase beta subunit